jgi:hypothetical protein
MKRAPLLAAAIGVGTLATPPAHGADAKSDCIAAADQGQSLRDDGKYRGARDAFTSCARDVCPRLVQRSCIEWLGQLEDAMPTVVLGAKDESGSDLARAHVTVDGEPLTEVLDGKPLPLDPGQHVLSFERGGSGAASTRVVLRAGEKNRAVTVTLRTSPDAAIASPSPSAEPAPDQTPHASFFTAGHVTALSLLVAGGAAIGVGAYFLGQAGGDADTASGIRGTIPPDACTRDASSAPCQSLSAAVDAHYRDETLAAVMLVGGGVLVVGAAVAWLAWPKAADERPATGVRWVAPGVAQGGPSLVVGGAF